MELISNTWSKKGLIFQPNSNLEWMKTHAALPIALPIKDNLFRIYFSTRNSHNQASVGYVELDITNPKEILHVSENPVLTLGKIGCFDDSGVMAHSIVDVNGKLYLYYTGWNQSKTVPFRWAIGLAISEDNGKTFERISEGPILDRNTIDPYFAASPTVIFEENLWKMWYISGQGWHSVSGKLFNPYHIRYAESEDGVNWKRQGHVAIDFKTKDETRIGRASVIKTKNFYQMWYSYASKNYEMGYAESDDGINWIRKDEESGINISKTGWDSEMIEYPFIFRHNEKTYLLYNGNNYGETGFGYALS